MHKIFICIAIMLSVAMASKTTYAASPKKFHTMLSGGQQVVNVGVGSSMLPVKGIVTGAYGEVKYHLTHNRSEIHYVFKAANTATPIFMAHFHLGPKGQNGPVVFWLYADASVNPNFPRSDGPFSGEVRGVLTVADLVMPKDSEGRVLISTFEDAVTNLVNGNMYVNVHTLANPGGEIRGQSGRRHHGQH